MPGFLFYNDEGMECGGLIFGGRHKVDGYSAFASLTFDQFYQDQVVQLSYGDEDGQRAYGLKIFERPTVPFAEYFARYEALQEMPEGQEKVQATKDFNAEFISPRRLFVGRNQAGEAIVVLADSKGRDRIRMRVDKDDVPRLEFLDEKGKVTYSLPPEQPRPR
ncbi:MAG: hypothetical protein ACYC41_12280 [Bacillota bacterium]